jgi:putative spermidine/putrescine transport system substrate-binding protein
MFPRMVRLINLLVLVLLIAACGNAPVAQPTAAPAAAQPTAAPAQPTAAPAQPTAAPAQPTAAPAQPTAAPEAAPATTNLSREQIAEQLRAEGATLNFYWPAGGTIKMWIDDTLIPGYQDYIREQYGVEMTVNILSTGGGDTAFMQKLAAYEQANPGGTDFDIDVVRIVPSVELVAAGAQGWLEPILPQHAELLPNLASVNAPGLESFSANGGTYAIPVYQPTISLFYNADEVPTPPESLAELLEWARANPNRFTYEDPRTGSGIGSGSMFLLAVMNAFADPNDPESFEPGFAYLSELQEYVYPQPTELAQMIELMKRGEIWVMAFWNDFGLSVARDQNIDFMQNIFPTDGMPVRNTPIAVPSAAAHKLAGLLFVDYALSPDVQRELALLTQQIPASVSPDVWAGLPPETFGFPFDYIESRTFAGFNNQANLAGIKAMVNGFSTEVLGR